MLDTLWVRLTTVLVTILLLLKLASLVSSIVTVIVTVAFVGLRSESNAKPTDIVEPLSDKLLLDGVTLIPGGSVFWLVMV